MRIGNLGMLVLPVQVHPELHLYDDYKEELIKEKSWNIINSDYLVVVKVEVVHQIYLSPGEFHSIAKSL